MTDASRRSSRGLLFSLMGLAFLAAGCTSPDFQFDKDSPFSTEVDNKGYREKFPIGVKTVNNAMELPGKRGPERLSPAEILRIGDMVDGFMESQSNLLVVAIPGGGAGDARLLGRAKQIGSLVKRRGLPASRLMLRVAPDKTDPYAPIVISYEMLVTTVPECGWWGKESSHDATNTTDANFGCSLQRNIGLMIDNPRDLIEPRKTTATHDATRSGVVLDAYRAGEETGAARADVESSATITAD